MHQLRSGRGGELGLHGLKARQILRGKRDKPADKADQGEGQHGVNKEAHVSQ